MTKFNRRLWRLASAIHDQVVAGRDAAPGVTLPTGSWDRCARALRQIHRAEFRGWRLAAKELRDDLSYGLASLAAEVQAVATCVPHQTVSRPCASVGDIYFDLVALAAEFTELEFDLAGRWLSVTTEPITLEDIYLGPFEIRLDLRRYRNDRPYRVIATDPHPAESRENVAHPHVMDEHLCEGDSRVAIREALAQGRVLDFFALIASGLRSYNSESPYVGLEVWYGTTCSDCGAVVDSESTYVCGRCGEVVCDSCEGVCTDCDETCCSGCLDSCPECDSPCCRQCLQACRACARRLCSGCLNEDERCERCHEQDELLATPDSAAVQSPGMGQAPVLA